MMEQSSPPTPFAQEGRDRLFPRLTEAQLDRLLQQGEQRPTAAGEILLEQGGVTDPFFAVVSRDQIRFAFKEIGPDVPPLPNVERHENPRWDVFISTTDPDELYREYVATSDAQLLAG